MHARELTRLESLDYLPAFFRAQVDPPGAVSQHFVRCLLEAFESNVHLAERIVEHSRMLFDPEEAAMLASKACPALLAPEDIVDPQSLAAKLAVPADRVSHHLSTLLPRTTQGALSDAPASDAGTLRETLAGTLNQIITGQSLDDSARFAGVKFSDRTRALRRRKPVGEASVRLNRLLLEDAYPREIAPMPEAYLCEARDWELEHLQWLACWIGLTLEPEWLAEATENPDQRFIKARQIIQETAKAYRRRGTPDGLKDIIKLFYDWDVEILERSWPQGMQIGVSSTPGVDCWLIDEPDLENQFVVVLKSSNFKRHRLPVASQRIQSSLTGQAAGRRVEWLLAVENPKDNSEATPAEEAGSAERLAAIINRLRALIDREKPAHTRYFLALETSQPPAKQPQLPPMVIGSDSVIEGFWMN